MDNEDYLAYQARRVQRENKVYQSLGRQDRRVRSGSREEKESVACMEKEV